MASMIYAWEMGSIDYGWWVPGLCLEVAMWVGVGWAKVNLYWGRRVRLFCLYLCVRRGGMFNGYCICEVFSIRVFGCCVSVCWLSLVGFPYWSLKGLWGEDAYACGVNNLLNCGKMLGEEGLGEFGV